MKSFMRSYIPKPRQTRVEVRCRDIKEKLRRIEDDRDLGCKPRGIEQIIQYVTLYQLGCTFKMHSNVCEFHEFFFYLKDGI